MKGNKGEWSELYVLMTLLAEGKLSQSDIHLVRDPENIYQITKAYKSESFYNLEFDREDDIKVYKINEGKEFIASYTIDNFKEISKALLNGINTSKGKTFSIDEVENFLNEILIKKLKADSNSKADIKLKIYDHRLAKETDLGFSIKSLLGNNSTLFNTGPGNNFIYKVISKENIDLDKFNKDTYKPLNNISKLTSRLVVLKNLFAELKFQKTQSPQLWKNLKMIDGDLPEIIAFALYYRWIYRTSSLKDVSIILEDLDPLNFYNGESSEQKLYTYKIKKFLTECAMGMTSEKPWLGEYDSFGGVIIAKNDGDIVCFHIYDFNLFRNYLLDNTLFEQASTGEDEQNPGYEKTSPKKKYFYGWLYKEFDELFIKINLQIRFK